MKILKIGVMPREAFQKRIADIAAGRYLPKRGEPKVWFNSMKSLAQVLNENNVELLKLIEEKKPETMKQLAKLSGRQESNLSRTLKTLERHGIVKLVKQKKSRAIKPIANATGFNIYYATAV